MGGLWNVNIHYDARLAACVPATARAVLDVLPGARVRRLLLGRYLLTWTRPPLGLPLS